MNLPCWNVRFVPIADIRQSDLLIGVIRVPGVDQIGAARAH